MERKLSTNQRAVIFANGEIKDDQAVVTMLSQHDSLIAADGGLNHMVRMGLTPNVLIGDLDSASPEAILSLEAASVPILRYPVDKNETDLELAIAHAISEGHRRIVIVGALGGRFDQALGNLFLLSADTLAGLDIRLDDGREEVCLIRSYHEIEGRAGDTVSLIPLGSPVTGILTQNLRYPLNHETLYPDHTRGISNVLLGDSASVRIESGLLVCIHTRG